MTDAEMEKLPGYVRYWTDCLTRDRSRFEDNVNYLRRIPSMDPGKARYAFLGKAIIETALWNMRKATEHLLTYQSLSTGRLEACRIIAEELPDAMRAAFELRQFLGVCFVDFPLESYFDVSQSSVDDVRAQLSRLCAPIDTTPPLTQGFV